MITFERSFDYPLIRKILTHPKIWDHISDDHSPPASLYQAIESESIWYVLAWWDEELLGLWMFHPQNGICWEVHTALLPRSWGPKAREAAQLLPAWIWANTPCRRIVTNVPSTNRLALHFAIAAGMQFYGTNQASYLKNGRLCDQVCLGISPMPVEFLEGEQEGETCGKER